LEVDGGQHADSTGDAVRDAWLKARGYRVLRFWNNDVIKNTNGVLEVIAAALQAESPPHPVLAEGADRSLPASGER
jgi:very-short-patch-repair endonuclease